MFRRFIDLSLSEAVPDHSTIGRFRNLLHTENLLDLLLEQLNDHLAKKQCMSLNVPYGLLKLHHGLGKARYLGLERNRVRAQLIAMRHNLKTGMNILKQMRCLQESCI